MIEVIAEEVVEVVVFVIVVVYSQELKYKNVLAIVLEKPLEIKKRSNQTEECWSDLLIPRKIALTLLCSANYSSYIKSC